MSPVELLQQLVSIPGPPGQEDQVADAIEGHLKAMRLESERDAKGNLIVRLNKNKPKVVVTAHMDEIALCVSQIREDGSLSVAPLGGIFPWKLGEGAVSVLAKHPFEAVLGFGSIHTESEMSGATRAKTDVLKWDMATVFTGLSTTDLQAKGVRPGTRVVVSPTRRILTQLAGGQIAGYFLDDRADLVSWLLALKELKDADVAFVATTSEEVGGEGAQYFLSQHQPDYCIALELGPNVPDAPVQINANPTVWAGDAYAAMPPFLADVIVGASKKAGVELQFQRLSRGGSDASCSAAKGLCAHPITLGLPMENSHGYEIIHPDSMVSLGKLTVELVRALA